MNAMRIYFVRHGIAEEPSLDRTDYDRALTESGVQRLRLQARALRRAGFQVSHLITSPLVRAAQTAALLGNELGMTADEEMLLAPGCSLADVQEILGRHADAVGVMLVGHQPDFGAFVRTLTGATVKMRKGTIADVELSAPGAHRGLLRGLYDPEVLASLGR